ncbi:hypothetical protein TWF481_004170 [Arthrobotrys musiformis]|uniref:Uncharacterized protein n=1 Tax=Arthrobotrys musiformis TaxID=47236 RepID=A0AAV9WKP0_9PEZI
MTDEYDPSDAYASPDPLERYKKDMLKIKHDHLEREMEIAEKMSSSPAHERLFPSFERTSELYGWIGRITGTLFGAYPFLHLYRRDIRRYEHAESILGQPHLRQFRPKVSLYLIGAALGIATGAQLASIIVGYTKVRRHNKLEEENPTFKAEFNEISRLMVLDQTIMHRDALNARIKLIETTPPGQLPVPGSPKSILAELLDR